MGIFPPSICGGHVGPCLFVVPLCSLLWFPTPSTQTVLWLFRRQWSCFLGQSPTPVIRINPMQIFHGLRFSTLWRTTIEIGSKCLLADFQKRQSKPCCLKKSTPSAGKMLSDHSLIKWDNKNNEEIIEKARKLIWVAHNSQNLKPDQTACDLLAEFDQYHTAIKQAEQALYSIPNRTFHHTSSGRSTKQVGPCT